MGDLGAAVRFAWAVDGMLFAARQLASRVPSSLDEALDAVQALSKALDDIAELQPQPPPE